MWYHSSTIDQSHFKNRQMTLAKIMLAMPLPHDDMSYTSDPSTPLDAPSIRLTYSSGRYEGASFPSWRVCIACLARLETELELMVPVPSKIEVMLF